jgi:hypothetical protein
LKIRSITAPFFLATKFGAFKGRGRRDYFGSHDLEHVLSVVDGRPELLQEVRAASEDLRAYLALELDALLEDSRCNAAVGQVQPSTLMRLPRLRNSDEAER